MDRSQDEDLHGLSIEEEVEACKECSTTSASASSKEVLFEVSSSGTSIADVC